MGTVEVETIWESSLGMFVLLTLLRMLHVAGLDLSLA